MKSKISKIKEKHHGGFFFNLFYEGFVRLYLIPFFRRALSFICGKKIPNDMVFLVGCYNSGTTILRDILKSHPNVGGMPREGVRFTDVFTDMQHGGWVRMAYHNRHLPPSFFSVAESRSKLDKDWGFWAKRNETVFLEKSITHSFRLEFIKEIYPEAKFIAITRDGYCSSEGIMRRAKPVGHAEKVLGKSSYPEELCAEQWAYINEKLLAFSENNASCLHIRFEDFVLEPEETVKTLFRHIGVDEKLVSIKGDVLYVADKAFPIKNTNPGSRNRFLKSQLNLDDFNRIAGETMSKFGYSLMSGDANE